MSGDDELLPEGVPSFDDPSYAELRAGLADARSAEPMPADVVARLDAVLAELSGSAAAQPPVEAPIPLRPRSRFGPRLLAAAAAVVVLAGGGIGLAKALSQHHGNVAADSAPAASAKTAGGSAQPSAGPAPDMPAPLHALNSASALPQLSSAHFGLDVSRLMLRGQAQSFGPVDGAIQDSTGSTGSATTEGRSPRATAVPPAATPAPAASPGAPAATDRANLDELAIRPPACAPQIPGTTTQPILLDGRPAVLVVHPAVGGYQLVEARDCTGKTILASTRLPA